MFIKLIDTLFQKKKEEKLLLFNKTARQMNSHTQFVFAACLGNATSPSPHPPRVFRGVFWYSPPAIHQKSTLVSCEWPVVRLTGRTFQRMGPHNRLTARSQAISGYGNFHSTSSFISKKKVSQLATEILNVKYC